MKKKSFLLFFIMCFIMSCSSLTTTDNFATLSPSATIVSFTQTPTLSPTQTSTGTPAVTPAFIEKINISNLALTETNVRKIIKLSVFSTPSDLCLISPNLDSALKVQVIDENIQYLLANKELESQIVNVWDIEKEEIIQTFDGLDIDGTFFHPEKNTLMTFSNGEKSVISFWDIVSGDLRNKFVLNRKNIYYDDFLSISPDGLYASTFSGYGNYLDIQISVFNFQSGVSENKDYVFALFSEEGPTSTQFYSSNGNLVAIVNGVDNKLHFLDFTNHKDILLEFPFGSFDEIISVGAIFSKASMSWDEKYIASSALNGEIYVWNTANGSLVTILKAHQTEGTDGWQGGIKNLEFAPESHLLLSVGYDGLTKLWNISSGDLLKEIKVCHHFGGFTQDGRYLITIGKNGIEKWGIP